MKKSPMTGEATIKEAQRNVKWRQWKGSDLDHLDHTEADDEEEDSNYYDEDHVGDEEDEDIATTMKMTSWMKNTVSCN